jgi:1-acyl-sn-glycerol-3-phosphate acyltransferase
MTAVEPHGTLGNGTLAMHSPLRAGLRLLAFISWTLLFITPYAALLGLGRQRLCARLARFYWRMVRRILGFDVRVEGDPNGAETVLFVSNHASYLDIVVLGSLLTACFVAKKEVQSWPGISVIAKLGRTVFVDRKPRRSLDQRDEILKRFSGTGERLILFPEGTSTDGNRVLPFKSALLSVAEQHLSDGIALPVQPVSLAYTRLDGIPMGRGWRPFLAWYGDMELAPHLWIAAGLGRTTVDVVFHPSVRLDQFGSRKALADHCHAVVRNGVAAANAGRLDSRTTGVSYHP